MNLAIDSGTRASGYTGYNLVYAIADGDPGTRWSGNNANSAWAQLDLGETQPVAAIRLRWEAAFAKTYKIQLSDDGRTWTDAYATPTAGSDGALDVITLEGRSARFVRMQTVTRALNYGPSLWEFEVFADRLVVDAPAVPTGKGNLALGRPTTADSVHNNLANITAPMATDGSRSTKWSSARAATEHWLRVDLGAVLPVSRAVVAWEVGTSHDYRIEGSVDGESWSPLVRVQSAQPTLVHTHDFPQVSLRYVRLAGLPATQYGLNIWELELYGGSAFECIAPVTAGRDGSAVVAATVSPVAPDDTFTAVSLDAEVATVTGEPRVSAEGRVEVDIATREPGRTQILLRHAGGPEVARCDVTVSADTATLQARIEAANALDGAAHTPASWAPLVPALDAAKRVLGTPGASQAEVDAAAAALDTALAGLVRRDAVPSAPRDVVATASGDSVQVQWSAPQSPGGSEITGYEVTVGGEVATTEASVLSVVLAGLPAGEHPVTVRAQNANGWSAASEPITVVVDPETAAPMVRVDGSPTVGGPIEISGSGFEPGVRYDLQLRSTPVDLGRVTAGDDGTFTFRGTVPRDVEPGEHTVVAMLGDADVASTRVVIAGDAGDLPGTGDDLGWLPWTLGLALVLLAAGLVAVRVRRVGTH